MNGSVKRSAGDNITNIKNKIKKTSEDSSLIITQEPEETTTECLIDKLISGQMSSAIKCVECEASTERPEEFCDIIIPVVKNKDETDAGSSDADDGILNTA